jgi:hypothetical protein
MKNLRGLLSCLSVLASLALVGCGGGGSQEPSSPDPIDSTPPPPTGSVLELLHKGLVFDTTRQIYYATVGSTDPVRGNRIAIVERMGPYRRPPPLLVQIQQRLPFLLTEAHSMLALTGAVKWRSYATRQGLATYRFVRRSNGC